MQGVNDDLDIIILAAGRGQRMQSSLPKVLHRLAGKPLLEHVISTSMSLKPQQVLVVHAASHTELATQFSHYPLSWVPQEKPLGTGHAVQQTLAQLGEQGQTLILYGDVPLISVATLKNLCRQTEPNTVGLLTATLANPSGLGRIIRNAEGDVVQIVEAKDASPEQQKIKEINTGILLLPTAQLSTWLPQLTCQNAQGEYYLTELIELAVRDHFAVRAVQVDDPLEITGVNTKQQLIALERAYQYQQAVTYIQAGLYLSDPSRFDCRGTLSFGEDVSIDVNVVCSGEVRLGNNVVIEPNCILRDVCIDDNVRIAANTLIEHSHIKAGCVIGPYARIRPQSEIGPNAKIGNFVEIKKSVIGAGSKAGHLSYLGDAVIGDNVNIGAGVITVNYDGANKHPTYIAEDVFVGCASQLVAPVNLNQGAFIAAGTTVTRDVPAGTLCLSRVAQRMIDGWQPPSQRKGK
jgi:bifunctional UDP-N-acetylglucosamine pyrophosphorylase / glucosamine-1-phosphate N-acetyltransferase